MNLHRAIQLLSRLPIKHRDTGTIVPFLLNPNQRRALDMYYRRLDGGKPLWVICVKSRRVGFSTLSSGLLVAHGLAKSNARALVVAHLFKSSGFLFEAPLGWVSALPFDIPKPTTQRIIFPHPAGYSTLAIATAGAVSGGRALTLSALHLSEAAYFPGTASFTSLLPTITYNDPDSILIIESTANGKVGQGETFYEYWRAAIEGRNEFLPVFLSWLDDPACVRDPEEAADAPANDTEKELMRRPYNASRAQIAWMRWCLETQCHGLEDVFMQEYPWDHTVAFLTTGDPAFSRKEIAYARSTEVEPGAIGHIEYADGSTRFEAARGGWHIYEPPDGRSWYFIGADSARGVEHGDFAAACVWNGHTGDLAARYAERVDPETFASILNAAGRHYCAKLHVAMMNVELTGNTGLWTQKLLRDMYHYPNLYIWKGRDDRKPNTGARSALGWETSYRSRERMFAIYRAALAHQRIRPKDRLLISQMEGAQRSAHIYDFEVKKGHDDVLMAGLIGWVAVADYPPPLRAPSGKKPFGLSSEEEERKQLHYLDDASTLLKRHLAEVEASAHRKRQLDRLGEL